MDYEEFCQSILKLDPKVRFAGICDETGEVIYGGSSPTSKSLLTKEETKRSLQQAWARWKLRNELAYKIGRCRYAMAEYEKVKRITLLIDESHLLLVTTDVNADHMRIINEVLKMKERLSTFK